MCASSARVEAGLEGTKAERNPPAEREPIGGEGWRGLRWRCVGLPG